MMDLFILVSGTISIVVVVPLFYLNAASTTITGNLFGFGITTPISTN